MRSHFVPACCNINNKGEHTLFHCVLLCVGHETRDKVSYLINQEAGEKYETKVAGNGSIYCFVSY